MISPAIIDEIKNRIDIVDVVNDFVELKKSGSSYKALSPFTSEKTPSFYVVPSKGIFKCFSSGKGGDAITFVMEMDGLSYIEALKYLAAKYGIEIVEEEVSDEVQEAQNRRESLYIALNYASEFFSELLHEHQEGKSIGISYFKERGFTDETIRTFKLGYSLSAWDHFHRTALEKGYQEDILEEAGLIVRKEDKVYDRFRGRVIFPIQNITGKVIGFGARILKSEKGNQPKYINSPETELYNKSQVLYGLTQAKQEIRKEENCYIVEGYTDVISLHQAGICNVVSSSGTALTEDQAKLIRRYAPNVTVLFDGDAAGIRASFRGIDILLHGGLNVKAVRLPEGEDPDSYCQKLGTSSFQHFLASAAEDFIIFKTTLLLEGVENDPIRRSEVIRDVVQSIAKIDDSIKRSVYIKECATTLEISEAVLIVELNKILLQESHERRKRQLDAREPAHIQVELPIEDEQIETLDIGKVIAHQEKESIRLIINYCQEYVRMNDEKITLLDYFLNESEEITFTHPLYRRIMERVRERHEQGHSVDLDYLMSIDDESIQQIVVDLSAPRYEISDFWKNKYQIIVPREIDQIKHVSFTNILRLKFWYVQHMIEEKKEQLKSLEDIEETDRLLEEFDEIKKVGKELGRMLGNVTVK